ncbi:ABC transporter permease [Vreelandella glaciei]|uniref:ABC transporter permease n=3 Tax=Vreelandella TaxID=3137766 RepID=A0A7Z0LWJ9_9GAMM|nr:ABC transporter permease [Halomonas glaciei]|tara:strand:- start:1219 stop:2073 length:855 start_codon:yes stop_codon:yes gene_type:complete
MQKKPRFFYWFLLPSTLTAFGLIVAMLAILQYSVRSYIPGSLEVGGFTFDNFISLLRPLYASAFLETVLLSLYTAIFTLIIGYPLAYAMIRARKSWCRSTILIISITPLFLGEVVRTYSWIIVLGSTGFINSLLMGVGLIERPLRLMFTQLGVVIALVHVTLPIMVLMLAAGLSHIDRSYERAAISLGAGPVRAFLTVTLPLSMPGIVAGTMTSFAWTFSAFATPQLIGGGQVNTISTLVYQLGFSSLNFPFAASLSIAGLVLTVIVLWLAKRVTNAVERLGVN